jgi:sugar-phosphatase
MEHVPAEGVLFDLDGVLVDSTRCLRQAWNDWAAGAGVDPARTFALGRGRTTLDHLRLAAPALATPDAVRELDEMEAANAGLVSAMPGAAEALFSLINARCGVVTSCSRAVALTRLRTAGLTAPAVLVSADDVARPKPAPDGYREGCARLGLPPGSVIVFEDAPAGVAAARAAGCRVVELIGDPDGFHQAAHSPADARITDLSRARFTVTATIVNVFLLPF